MHDFTSKKLQNRQSQVEGEKKFDGGWGKKNMMGERRHEGQLLEGERWVDVGSAVRLLDLRLAL